MPIPTHMKPLPLPKDTIPNPEDRNLDHPLAPQNPTSPTHKIHKVHKHQLPERHRQAHQHHLKKDSRLSQRQHQSQSQPQSPNRNEHDVHSNETDRMLPFSAVHPHNPHQQDAQSHHSHVTEEHTHEQDTTNTSSLPTLPPKSPVSPKSPSSPSAYTPLSKRLLLALTNKPKLSKTWENRSYAEQQRSAPLDAEMMSPGRAELGMDLHEYSSPRSRPISFYASPAEIAAFQPLPMVDHDLSYPDETHQHHHHQSHSAPNLPAQPTHA
ncbi:uncharacterized protein L201_001530 [Kwoniella dendrophila CBS 6074]|uniref:Uncharacterized protein n=1 Tax=Kwoniella dendrophila CBS 6074 TaxID=1295534 RepID=A0AAX4JQA9_9TREE